MNFTGYALHIGDVDDTLLLENFYCHLLMGLFVLGEFDFAECPGADGFA